MIDPSNQCLICKEFKKPKEWYIYHDHYFICSKHLQTNISDDEMMRLRLKLMFTKEYYSSFDYNLGMRDLFEYLMFRE